MADLHKRLPLVSWIYVIGFIVIFGIAGFMVIEGYSFLDALYMVIITITTIGYHEVHPLSVAGRVFNIVLILTSFSTLTFLLAKFTQFVASGDLTIYFKNRQLMQAIQKKQNHVVICGFGRNGQQAAKTLKAQKIDFVVVEKNKDVFDDWMEHEDNNLVYLLDDATDDDALIKAGVEKARALLITLPEDADNVFIVLSARSMNQNLLIISRASNPTATAKLYKAGADNVIMPDMIGGTHMATLVSKPDVLEFIDFLSGEDGQAIHIESVSYDKLPRPIRDKTLKEIMDWKKTGVNCIGIKDERGKFVINPPDTTVICTGMKVMVLGTLSQIAEMKINVGDK
jgi:voltage-gated potassium channel